jgi:hypothetical protein
MVKRSRSSSSKSAKLQVENGIHKQVVDSIELEPYSTLDIVKSLDIPRERLRDWMNRGFITPSKEAKGQGTKALFSRIDVYAISLFRYLVERCKFVREEAARYTNEWLAKVKSEEDSGIVFQDLVAFGRATAKEGEEIISLRSLSSQEIEQMVSAEDVDWDSFFVVNFRKIREEVDAQLS